MRPAWLALALLAAGCDVLRPPTDVTVEPRLQLHSALRAGSDTVAVLLERSGMEDGYLQVTPVSGARVRLEGAGEAVTLAEAPQGFPPCLAASDYNNPNPQPAPIAAGCYAAVLPGGVQAGRTYSLSVEVPGGGTITGRTTVPHVPDGLQPEENARIRMVGDLSGWQVFSEPVTLRWRSPLPGSSISAYVDGTEIFRGGSLVADAGCRVWLANPERPGPASWQEGADSVRVRGEIGGCTEPVAGGGHREIRPDSVAADLQFVAVDANFASFPGAGGPGGVREENASAGITGAYGFFGSSARTSRRIVFVYPDG